jgi:hypothetical protein
LIKDKRTNRRIDALYLALLRTTEHTLLPELYSVFGKDLLIKFLNIFGGTTIKIPAVHTIKRAVRDVEIYLTLRGLEGQDKQAAIRRIASEYEITDVAVYLAYQEVSRDVEQRFNIKEITRRVAGGPGRAVRGEAGKGAEQSRRG